MGSLLACWLATIYVTKLSEIQIKCSFDGMSVSLDR